MMLTALTPVSNTVLQKFTSTLAPHYTVPLPLPPFYMKPARSIRTYFVSKKFHDFINFTFVGWQIMLYVGIVLYLLALPEGFQRQNAGVTVTMIIAVNAIGNHVPPMLVFPRVHFKNHMLTGAPTASFGDANPTVW
jgi:predicted CDP-diglyceride synthetase/phosphatidate cytidylyltransferase